jgi:hypothetical protein
MRTDRRGRFLRGARPVGTPDSSPAFKRRVADKIDFRPLETVETVVQLGGFISGVPTARVSLRVRGLASEMAGYYRRSLRTFSVEI